MMQPLLDLLPEAIDGYRIKIWKLNGMWWVSYRKSSAAYGYSLHTVKNRLLMAAVEDMLAHLEKEGLLEDRE